MGGDRKGAGGATGKARQAKKQACASKRPQPAANALKFAALWPAATSTGRLRRWCWSAGPSRLHPEPAVGRARRAAAALNDRTTLTTPATLEYEGCDDTVCFIPQSVPLSWTIALRPLDRERVKQ